MTERLLTLDQVADRWQVAKGLLYRMTEDGRLERVKIGKYVRIPLAAVEAYENQNNNGSNRD